MAQSEYDIVVIGAGAAGIAAGQRLAASGRSFVILEARARLGGRCWSLPHQGYGLDLGAGWLHAASRNLWRAQAEQMGFEIDRSPAPWERRGTAPPQADQDDLRTAQIAFRARLDGAETKPDRAAADYLQPGLPGNARINAQSAFLNGAPLDQISTHDYLRYDGAGGNLRLTAGYGALLESIGAQLPVSRETIALSVDHSGARLKVETNKGALAADAVIVTVPTASIADGALRFIPDLPEQRAAADGLKLGVVDKAFIGFDDGDLPPGSGRAIASRSFGVSFDLRPMGRPVVEMFAAGPPAEALEREGEAAMAAYAIDEIVAAFGSGVRAKLHPLAASLWGRDTFARGSYSYAAPSQAGARDFLATPALERILFAGEAVAGDFYGTAHGAGETGIAAAEHALRTLKAR